MLIECVPNVSEGHQLDLVAAIADAVRHVPGARLLDYSADRSHNRSVFTFVGPPEAVSAAALALLATAVAAIDLRAHRGEHPRIGAVDVVPFVPIENATIADCVTLARSVGAEIAARFDIPVFLYEAAATRPWRQRLENIRRGGFEHLGEKMTSPDWTPDFGPSAPHPTAGATAVGARMPLVAYNINLATDRIDVARQIAAAVRTSSGGLPCVKAIGVQLAERGIVQVSMNLTDYAVTSMPRVFQRVHDLATEDGVQILESEVIGLVPAGAFGDATPASLALTDFRPDQILEHRIRNLELKT
jgi:glutamate formiminotransferase